MKSASVSSETLDNLLAAYNGERNATFRYIAFAVQADKEGYIGVGSLFRAVAHAEQVHATNHARVLRMHGAELELRVQPLDVRSTVENLRAALRSEEDERDQMYPLFAEAARSEGSEDASESFDSAAQAEASHAVLFSLALEDPEGHRDRAKYLVCAICGWVSAATSVRRCVLCSASRSRFERFE